MKKYVCNVCGYVYDPAEVCPLCSAPKEDFSEE